MANWRTRLDLLVTAAMLVAAGAIIWSTMFGRQGRSAPVRPLPSEAISLTDAEVIGSPSATVIIVEYLDFQCPFCAKFSAGMFDDLRKRYVDPGTVKFAVKQFPLSSIHKEAVRASAAAVCAGKQGKYWEMQTSLFQAQKELAEAKINSIVAGLQLDREAFAACLSPQMQALSVQAKETRDSGISGTPTFLVGRLRDGKVDVVARVDGPRTVEEFGPAIQKALNKQSSVRTWIGAGSGLLLVLGVSVYKFRRRRQALAAST